MKWNEVRRALSKKSGQIVEESGSKHYLLRVYIGDIYVGFVLVSRGSDDMKGHEIGNCARSLLLKEHEFRRLVGCEMSAEDFALRFSQ